jgi:hypothetical protein
MTERAGRDLLESTRIDARRILAVAAGVLAFLGASLGMLALIYITLGPHNGPPAPRSFPQPQLQAHPSADLRHYLAQQRAHLTGYRWTNDAHTLVAIPIERAMGLVVARGVDAYAPISPQQRTQGQP